MLTLRRPPSALPLLIAHRGASALAPENTMAAFRLAVEAGADLVELDVRLSADGHPVVIHDAYLSRTTDGLGPVARTPLAALQRLDAGSWFAPRFAGERIPTLDEVLRWAQSCTPPIPLMVELKGGRRALKRGLAEACARLVLARRLEEKVMFIAAHLGHLGWIRQAALPIATGTIIRLGLADWLLMSLLRRRPALEHHPVVRWRLLRPLRATLAVEANCLSVPATALTRTLVEAAHRAGLAVSPGGARWAYPQVIALGADTVSADDPAAVRRAFLAAGERLPPIHCR